MPLPLDLFAEVQTADGSRYKWDANQPPGSRLQNFSFRTKIGEGFSDAAGQLARRIDQDYPDLNLVDTITFTGSDGSVAYEGRVSSMPRDLSDRHSIGVTLAGWMAHAKDRKFQELYVDRDLSVWRGPSTTRQAALLGAGYRPTSGSVTPDENGGLSCLKTSAISDWGSSGKPSCEAVYDSLGIGIGSVYYAWRLVAGGINPADTNWSWKLWGDDEDGFAASSGTSELRAAGPSTGTFAPPSGFQGYVMVSHQYTTGPVADANREWALLWTCLAVYGRHGLTLRGTADATNAQGVFASDVIRDIAGRFCSQLDVSGVQATDLVINQLAFRDRTYPYDAFLEVNKYHLWSLGVWEDKRLDFKPYDLTDYDWEIRTDDPGTSFAPQGPSTDSLFNGIAVTFTNLLTGTVHTITPDTNPELADTSTENPWNQSGVDRWDEISLSTPTTTATAAQLGVVGLADRNRPKTPGTIMVRGYIRDRQGNEQPVWKVRAGDTISVTNFPNDTPRLIVETDYDDETKTISLAIDKPFALLDAYLDRQANALQAAGLA